MGIVVATQNTVVHSGGRTPVVVRKGEAWDADDPLVAAHPDLFTTDGEAGRRSVARPAGVVEQSTRAPGEKSRTRRTK